MNDEKKKKEQVLMVGGRTSPVSLKASILGYLNDNDDKNMIVYLDFIGVKANYIATRAMIMARVELAMRGKQLRCEPIYKDFEIENPQNSKVKTGVRWTLYIEK